MNKAFIISTERQAFKDNRTTCPICGKSFYVQLKSSYTYKRNNKNGTVRYSCSNSCYNKLCDAIARSVKTR